ncbi:hypothetical protein P171DRAFT_521728 [Karstenula rhodostoma CBS 690.94]|uniref:Uncharacterized protein n=1 Tax=Karstenula rhodostoma CBS 690.94 TaxID=1392251 RepID=A0A9P4PHZ5_9PLEO|nr:hypothetical protein P171DRAFT_521728 [Karstenula rhodostoma CBS 690.94]
MDTDGSKECEGSVYHVEITRLRTQFESQQQRLDRLEQRMLLAELDAEDSMLKKKKSKAERNYLNIPLMPSPDADLREQSYGTPSPSPASGYAPMYTFGDVQMPRSVTTSPTAPHPFTPTREASMESLSYTGSSIQLASIDDFKANIHATVLFLPERQTMVMVSKALRTVAISAPQLNWKIPKSRILSDRNIRLTEHGVDGESCVNLDTQDVEWHEHFQPAGHGSAFATTNPALSDITLPDDKNDSSKYSVHTGCLTTYNCLIEKLIEEELHGSRALQGTDVILLKTICPQVLFAMDKGIVHAILRDDRAQHFVCDADVKIVLECLWRSQTPETGSKQSSVQPAIYIQYLVGNIIVTLRRSEKGYRKYRTTKGPNSNKQRMEHLRTFCNAFEKHTLDHAEDASSHPLREVGYSKRCHYRLQQHRCHTSSNWLMNLIEAICEEAFNSRFHLAQFVVARLFAPAQASVAEILVTRLAEGYITSGVGMSFWNAGQNNASALDFSAGDNLQFGYETELEQREKQLEKQQQAEKEHQANVFLGDFLEHVLEEQGRYHQAVSELRETSRIVEYLRITLEQMVVDEEPGQGT